MLLLFYVCFNVRFTLWELKTSPFFLFSLHLISKPFNFVSPIFKAIILIHFIACNLLIQWCLGWVNINIGTKLWIALSPFIRRNFFHVGSKLSWDPLVKLKTLYRSGKWQWKYNLLLIILNYVYLCFLLSFWCTRRISQVSWLYFLSEWRVCSLVNYLLNVLVLDTSLLQDI